MLKNKTPLLIIGGVFLFFLDQFFKYQALHGWSAPRTIGNFGWSPFLNPGIAFSLPLPGWVTIVVTIPIIAFVGYLLIKEYGLKTKEYARLVAFFLIFIGALSNLIDRVLYGITVDYLRFFTSVINLGDVLIILGFGVYFWGRKKV